MRIKQPASALKKQTSEHQQSKPLDLL